MIHNTKFCLHAQDLIQLCSTSQTGLKIRQFSEKLALFKSYLEESGDALTLKDRDMSCLGNCGLSRPIVTAFSKYKTNVFSQKNVHKYSTQNLLNILFMYSYSCTVF